MAYSMFGFYRTKEELRKGNALPTKILIEKSASAKNKYIVFSIGNKKLGSVIEKNEIEKMIDLTGKKEFAKINYPILSNELIAFSFEYLYWKDKLYELKVNGYTIIKKKANPLLM